jgi:hypothetical protein
MAVTRHGTDPDMYALYVIHVGGVRVAVEQGR